MQQEMEQLKKVTHMGTGGTQANIAPRGVWCLYWQPGLGGCNLGQIGSITSAVAISTLFAKHLCHFPLVW